MLAEKYGPKMVLLISLVVSAVFNALTPIAASWGWEYVCADRIIQGLAQGLVFPSVHTMLARWVHASERGLLSNFAYSGNQLGTVLMLAVSGVIVSSTLGWPGIFYISGAFSAVWCVVWAILGCDSPSVSKKISLVEREFIESSKGVSTKNERKSTPWKQIFWSKAFWALLTVHCGHMWGFSTLLTEIPSYMKDVLEYDIKSVSELR